MTVNINKHLTEQITHRYIQPSTKKIKGIGEILYSTSIPYRILNNESINLARYVISPNLASMHNKFFNSTRIHNVYFSNLMSVAKTDNNNLRNNMAKIQAKDINITSIGYGGFSINVIHFIKLLSNEIGFNQPIFNKIIIYEDDNISFTNSFRIYKDMSTILADDIEPTNKISLLNGDESIAKSISFHNRRFNYHSLAPNTFYFGAPDFETRKQLESYPFIFTGHSGNEVEFYSRPIVDSDLSRETYGKIDLDYFFINILKSAERLIEIFANTEPSDLELDKKLFNYNAELATKGEQNDSSIF